MNRILVSPDDEAATLEDVARFLKLDVKTVSALAKRGELPLAKVGVQWRGSRRQIEAWLRDRCSKNQPHEE